MATIIPIGSPSYVTGAYTYVMFGGSIQPVDFRLGIAFAAIFGVLLVGLIARTILPTSRTSVLVAPIAFTMIRTAQNVLRAMMARHSGYPIGIVIAEEALYLCGSVLLVVPVVHLFEAAIKPATESWARPIRYWATLLRIVLVLLVIPVAVVGGTAGRVANSLEIARTTTVVCSAIALAIGVLVLIATPLVLGFLLDAPAATTLYLFSLSLLVSVSGAYRVWFEQHPFASTTTMQYKGLFYGLSSGSEVLAILLIVAVALPALFESLRRGTPAQEQERMFDEIRRADTHSSYEKPDYPIDSRVYAHDDHGYSY